MQALNEKEQRRVCDQLVEIAAEGMQQVGAPVGMILDRLLTYAIAQACAIDGSTRAAENLRAMADRVDAGIFDAIIRCSSERRAKH